MEKLRASSLFRPFLMLNYVASRSNFRAFLHLWSKEGWKETMRLNAFAVAARVALRLKNPFTIKAADSSSWMKSLNGLATRETRERLPNFNQLPFNLWLCLSFVEEEMIDPSIWPKEKLYSEYCWILGLIRFRRRSKSGRRILENHRLEEDRVWLILNINF